MTARRRLLALAALLGSVACLAAAPAPAHARGPLTFLPGSSAVAGTGAGRPRLASVVESAPRGALGEIARLGPPPTCEDAFRVALEASQTEWAESGMLRVAETAGEHEEEARRLSPMKAALMSAIVPGLGQFMSGHPKMGAAYLGVEAAGWTGYSILRTEGFDKRRDARHFADVHYDSTAYNRRKDESVSDLPNRELPYNDDLEYYEDISKLNEVIWGWDDHVPQEDVISHQLLPGTSNNRESYKGERNEGNDQLRNSRNIGMLLFVNHIASAIHAFKLVQWYNKNVNREFSGLKFRFKQTADKQGFACAVSKRF